MHVARVDLSLIERGGVVVVGRGYKQGESFCASPGCGGGNEKLLLLSCGLAYAAGEFATVVLCYAFVCRNLDTSAVRRHSLPGRFAAVSSFPAVRLFVCLSVFVTVCVFACEPLWL